MTNPEELSLAVAEGAPDVPFPVDPLSDLVHYLRYSQTAQQAKVRLVQFVQLATHNTKRQVDDCEKRAQFFKDRLRPHAIQELEKQAGVSKTFKTPLGGKLSFRAQKPKLVAALDGDFLEEAVELEMIDELVNLGVLRIKYSVSKTGLRKAIENGKLPDACQNLASIEEEAPPDSFSISFDDEAGFLELASASDIRPDDSHLVYVSMQDSIGSSVTSVAMGEG